MAAKKARKTTKRSTKKVAKKKSARKPAKKSAKKKATKKSATVTLGGNPVRTSGVLPKVGAKAPAFALTTGTLSEIGPKELKGKRVILNIFPSIDTGTCAKSVRRFNELASSMSNTVVMNVSEDLPFAQKRFCGAEGITNVQNGSCFRSDFGNSFGVKILDGALKGLLARAVVVVDEQGVVTHTELVSEIAQEPNYDAALAALR